MSTSDRTPTVVLVHGAFVDAAYLTGFVQALGPPAVPGRRQLAPLR